MFQVIELLSLAYTDDERRSVEDALSVLKFLGLNGKSAPRIAEYAREVEGREYANALIAGICRESRLPLLTWMKNEFERFPGLVVVDPAVLELPPHNSDRV